MTAEEMVMAPVPPTPSRPAQLIEEAVAKLKTASVECASDFRGKPSDRYHGCELHLPEGHWAAIRGPQNATSARLIDAAAAFRYRMGAVGVVAILDPPAPFPKRGKLPGPHYVRRYQAAAWYGLNIVFTFSTGPGAPCAPWDPGDLPASGDFGELAGEVSQELDADKASWIPVDGSNEAEGLVRPSVHRVLVKHGFKRDLGESQVQQESEDEDGATGRGKGFQGFWRRGASDGMWVRGGGVPRRVALEVKLHEDVEAPLCQVIDDLGAAGAVLAIRVGGNKGYGAGGAPMRQLQQRLPVRYVEVDWQNPV